MELTVLGSSSSGNSYVLQNDTEALVIECGVSLKEVKKAVDFNVSKLVGALITHEHLDHSKYVREFLNSRIPVFMSYGTGTKLGYVGSTEPHLLPVSIDSASKFKLGKFTILPFDVKHDAAEPLGFLINHPETGNVLFLTDSYYSPYRFEGLNNILIECNYSTDILQRNIDAGRIPPAVRNRTLQSHMSLETCLETLAANDLSQVNNIVLIHLSDGNSHADNFLNTVHRATGKTVHVADTGMNIKFNKTPF